MKFPKDFTPPDNIKLYDIISIINWFHQGILYCYHKPGIEHTLEHAAANKQLVKELSATQKIFVIIDIRDAVPLSMEVRKFYNAIEKQTPPAGMGLLIKSPFSKVLGNLFLLVLKTNCPVKLFHSVASAIRWAKKNKFITVHS